MVVVVDCDEKAVIGGVGENILVFFQCCVEFGEQEEQRTME